jgi:hypothetical protein
MVDDDRVDAQVMSARSHARETGPKRRASPRPYDPTVLGLFRRRPLIAAERDADVFDLGDGTVRRSRSTCERATAM